MRTFRVVVFGTDPQSRNQYIILSIAAALRRDPRVREAVVASYLDVVSVCQAEPVDLLIVVGGAGAVAMPVMRAAELSRRSVLWCIEDPYEQSANVELGASHFDMVLSNDRLSVSAHRGVKKFMPLAGSLEFHDVEVREHDDELLWDVFFAGTAWPNRVRDVSRILSMLGGRRKCRIALPRNWALDPAGFLNTEIYSDFRLSPREYAKFANRARVTLTLDREFSTAQLDTEALPGGSPPPRLFEMALAGTCQIYLSQRQHSASFYDEREVVAVQTIEAAVEAIDCLIGDPKLRKEMATAAQKKTRKLHTYDNRVRELLDAALSLPVRLGRAAPEKCKKRVLHVTHNMIGNQPFGGVEIYQANLSGMMPDWDFYFLYPDKKKDRLVVSSANGGELRSFDYVLPADLIYDHRYNIILQDVLADLEVDLVHYQHLIGHPFTAPLISRALGVPSIFTVHDYYSMCDAFNLIDHTGNYCGVSDDRTERCDVCMVGREVAAPGSQARRRWVTGQVLEHVDAICHNTRFTKTKMTEMLPGLDPKKHRIVGMMGNKTVLRRLALARQRLDQGVEGVEEGAGNRLKVVVLGNLTRAKGGDWLMEAFKQLRADRIDFEISGRIDEEYTEECEKLDLGNVVLRGPYSAEDLPARLIGADVSVHLSVWPETYCISLDEARAAGLVPIVTDVGALGERVRHGENGFKVSLKNPMEIVRVLRMMVADKTVLASCRANASDVTLIPDNHVAALARLYEEVSGRSPVPHVGAAPDGYHRKLQTEDLPIRFNSQFWREASLYEDYNPQPLDELFLSTQTMPNGEEIAPAEGQVGVPQKGDTRRMLQSLSVDDVMFGFGTGGKVLLNAASQSTILRVLFRTKPDMSDGAIVLSNAMRSMHFNLPSPVSVGGRWISTIPLRSEELPAGTWQIGVEYEHDSSRMIFDSAVELEVSRTANGGANGIGDFVADESGQARRAAAKPNGITAFHLDRFGRELAESPHLVSFNLTKDLEVSIRGWAVPSDQTSIYDGFLVCIAPEGRMGAADTIAIPCHRQNRADVLNSLGLRGLDERVGFIARLPLRPFKPGRYDVSIVARRQKSEWQAMQLPKLEILGAAGG